MQTLEAITRVVDAVDIPLCVVDRDLRYTLVNRAYRELLAAVNVDLGDPIGRRLPELVPFLNESLLHSIEQIFVTGEPVTRQDTFDFEGRTFCGNAHMFPVLDGSTVIQVATVIHDVTVRSVLKEAARESNETARALMNSSTAIMILADTTGRIIDCNEPAAKWFGRPLDEIIGRLGQEIATPEWVASVTPYFVEVLFQHQPVRFQFSSGDQILDTSIVPIFGGDGYVERFAIFASDITQQSRAVDEIRESEARFSAMFHSSPDAMAISSLETGLIVDVNENWTRTLGYTREESVGRRSSDLGLSEGTIIRDELIAILLREKRIREYPIRLRHKSGHYLDVEINCEILRLGSGQLLFSVLRDVTQRKRAEGSLRESEERFRIMADSTPAIIWVTDTEGNNIFVNRAYQEFIGGPQELVEGSKWQLKLHPDDAELYISTFFEALKNRAPFYGKTRIRRHDGEWRWIDSYATPRFSATGEFQGMSGSSPDVTERTAAEEAVRQSEERFRLQFESIPVPTYIWEKRGDDMVMVDFNPAAVDFTRGGVAKFLNHFAREMHAGNPQIIEDLITCATTHTLIRRQLTYQFQLSPVTTFLDVQYVPLPPHRVLVHTVDLTAHKRTEEELRESRQSYRDLVENVNDIIYAVDRDGILTYVSPAVTRVLGYDPLELIGLPIWSLVCPEDLPLVREAFVDVLNNELYPSEYRLVSKSGEFHWMQTSSRPIMHNDEIIGLRGVAVDIDKRKATEEELRKAHHSLELRVQERTRELARANEQLEVERETLQRKNLVLQELVAQIENSRHHAALQILSNIERVVLPIISHLEGRLDDRSNRYVGLLKQTLTEITAPFAATLDSAYRQLTPVEIEICNLIRRGSGSKQIAELRHSSVQTVVKQRKVIRRKLGIDSKKVSLAHYLAKLESDTTKFD